MAEVSDSGCEADMQTTEQLESQDPAHNSQSAEDSNQGDTESSSESNNATVTTSDREMQDQENSNNSDGNSTEENESSFESNHATVTTSDREMQDEKNTNNSDGNSTEENESSFESNHATVTTSVREMQDEEHSNNNDGNSTYENESSSESSHATVTTSDRKMQDEENSNNNDGNSTKENDKEKLDLSENEKGKEHKEIDAQEESDSQVDSTKGSGVSDFSTKDYELIDGHYYYTDSSSGLRYRYDTDKEEWVETEQEGSHQVTTDSEGRTYYYADGLYLCRDAEGNVFFMDEKEWRPWEERTGNYSDKNNWYFYQGNAMFYRDKASGAVYKFNKDENKWEKFEGKLKRKRPRIHPDEEFDSDEDDGSDEESHDGTAPSGAKSDPSIRFDGTTYTKVDPSDKMEYEWDVDRRAWFPKVDEDFMATYQLSYGFNPDGTKNENPLKFDDDEEEEEEARQKEEEEKKLLKEKEKKNKKKPTWFEMDDAQNTKVYVTNLPDNMTEEEFIALMQKCGMLLLNTHSGHPKVKLYHDKDGNFKGDALCTYIKIESVELALQILDDYEVDGRRIHVEPAKFQQKGDYDPKLKPRKKPKRELEKLQRRQEKLFDWRPDPLRGERRKHETTVILRNVFDPKEFETAMEKILDHKEAMRNQCSHFGTIKKFELYDLHPEGVVQVTFEEVESADMCVATLHKRLYCGRTLTVATWDGKEKFRIQETKEEKEERLKKWNQFLESDSSSEKTSGEKKCAEIKTKDK